MEIPAVRELLEEVVDKPSLWSVVRHGGVQPSFNFFWTAVRAVEENRAGVPDSVYQLPVRTYLNGKLGLNATFAVTRPRGPLTTCAGIVALCAEHPQNPRDGCSSACCPRNAPPLNPKPQGLRLPELTDRGCNM